MTTECHSHLMRTKHQCIFKHTSAFLREESMFENVLDPGLQFRVLANLSITLVVEAKYPFHQPANQEEILE